MPSRVIMLVALLLLVAGACKPGESAVADEDGESSQSNPDETSGGRATGGKAPGAMTGAPPADFTMIFGEGGGFAGRWEGYSIRPDGAVLAWSGPTAEEESTPIGSLTDEQIDNLWAQVQDANFFDQNVRETGNITAFMEITAGERTHRVSWIPGAEGFEPPRSAIDELYRHSLRIAGEAAN